ncbi:putative uncharacterized protein [Corynebacterium casei UCMA 3821]|uniref:Uncharacterized protein n=1 Tax=Corynebacterium casei UCMA 3821 TaxID=1110505 RepID=G7HTZ1_9CORY|nr:hypothetical protein [Corynebacterium casei]CCE53656.1 putative uncharacterized protein [Corynebacterium casei UCMA 3821]CCE54447.1 putative uncharacterized protein [Corynebacterium casei UCMA 3821]
MAQHAEPTTAGHTVTTQPEKGRPAEQQKGMLGNPSVDTTGARPGDINDPKTLNRAPSIPQRRNCTSLI